MKIVCIYHDGCVDGVGAAWALSNAYPDTEVRYIPMQDRQPLPEVPFNSHVYLVGFSFTTEQTKELIRRCAMVTILDHHPHAAATVAEVAQWAAGGGAPAKHVQVVHPVGESSALMTWKHFFLDTPAPRLLEHISDSELLKFELEGTREIISALGMYPLTVEQGKILFATHGHGLINHLHQLAPTALMALNRQAEWAIKHTLRYRCFDWVGLRGNHRFRRVPVINCPRNVVSTALSQLAEPGNFALAYYDMAGTAGRKFSVQSNDIDVRPIARYFGGDGYERAAAFTVDREHALAKI